VTESRQDQVELANMAGIIERLAGELALGEEPARFIAALMLRNAPSPSGDGEVM